ncbi:hypothetical protein CALVIDRAFT_569924 [Calocera viscosa TUFC12733]|uniref:Uncharacterized protein n=1 Tax=Calocera viscosa (strain TUFC12733) TaxID=1330018 RepID=A0A167FFB0_CALVF|nr:hypothetical protein CALVIDRAFT_569924 [Calocera viscosa TUFC12733]
MGHISRDCPNPPRHIHGINFEDLRNLIQDELAKVLDNSARLSTVHLASGQTQPENNRYVERHHRDIEINIQLQTVDSGKRFNMLALLDSGATGLFLDTNFVRTHGISMM